MFVFRAASLILLVEGTFANSQLRGSAESTAAETAPAGESQGPYLEEPHETDAEHPKPELENWQNSTSLQPSASWGGFCAAHRVGYFCQGFTRVRCCRNTWGFVRCGSFAHFRGCGWHGGWGAGGWHYDEVAEGEGSAPVPEIGAAEEDAGVYPDETTGFDEVGPYLAVPDESEAENPKAAIAGWDNGTSLQAAAFHSWGRSFCEVHHTGYFCDGFTRVRCCQQQWGFVKCGTTARSNRCGYHGSQGGAVTTGGGWVIHQGWRQSSFCRAHHTGYFCYQHSKVHCCADHGHFVECSTSVERSWRC